MKKITSRRTLSGTLCLRQPRVLVGTRARVASAALRICVLPRLGCFR
ncbi:hypothetical protein APY03_0036 [Variovorax sp. WDL1]|nr:hypothetical protein APY03_0036 [Variovorax sp. WDL1]